MLKCEFCGIESEEVECVTDPYLQEIYGEEELIDLCPNCLDSRLGDI
jgi:hypothetical protein